MDSMFDTLLQLPLFQGLAYNDFTRILERVKLDFVKYRRGEVLVQAGDDCGGLMFILRGKTRSVTVAPSGDYTLTEYMPAGTLIEPQALFGMHTRYTATHTASVETHTVSIDKTFVMNELFCYPIFLLNYVNIVSNRAQTFSARLWSRGTGDTQQRIAAFFLSLMERPMGPKTIHIKSKTLACIVGETRPGTVRALQDMQERGLLHVRNQYVSIADAARLVDELGRPIDRPMSPVDGAEPGRP